MDVSVIGSSQAKIFATKLASTDLRFCLPTTRSSSSFSFVSANPSTRFRKSGLLCFTLRSKLGSTDLRFCLPTTGSSGSSFSFVSANPTTRFRKSGLLRFNLKDSLQSEPLPRSHSLSGGLVSAATSEWLNGFRLFVGLPLDAVSDCNTLNHAKAIAVGLKALKLLGVEGVEMPVWWGIVEKEAMGKYEWSGYLALAEMVQNAGLKLHVSLCFHASQKPKIPLPDWVLKIGEEKPGLFYTDRSGHHYKGCLSLAVDDLPVLHGHTPVQKYHGFCESFRSTFSHFMGSTITGVTMGLGPDGELQYPSHHQPTHKSKFLGAGEFQCYDKNMLDLLKQHAEANGNPLWGLGGPHDAPIYDQLPNSSNFFKDNGGSWESQYGSFFLSWYSNQLVSHGDSLLSLASNVFSNTAVSTYGKVPLMHSWYRTRSHPSEVTAGFYNTVNRDGYDAVAEMFARNSCKMILPGMDLSDEYQTQESLSSPELLLSQIRRACKKHGVKISGQNSMISNSHGFKQIRKNTSGENLIDLFIYQRMGADFFSPEHFPSFTEFVRGLNQLEIHSDDMPAEEVADSLQTSPDSGIQMQLA